MTKSRLFNEFLEARNISLQDLIDMSNIHTQTLKDCATMATLLDWAKHDQRKIVLLSDHDMDGIMASVLGRAGFDTLGFDVDVYEVDTASYGFGVADIMNIVDTYGRDILIITSDVGITCKEALVYAHEHHIDIVVTDHHRQQEVLPAQCIVNPMRLDETDYPLREICGATVLYLCLLEYAQRYGSSQDVRLIERLRVFAGMGTISDAMPVRSNNRSLIHDMVHTLRVVYPLHGILYDVEEGSPMYRQAFFSLSALLGYLSRKGKCKSVSDVDEVLVGFFIAPMFNSIKRLNASITLVRDVFFTTGYLAAIDKLYNLNETRKTLVKTHMLKIEDGQPYAPYVYISDAPKGILGLLAQQLCEKSGMPTICVRSDGNTYHGSARSPEWYPMYDKAQSQGVFSAGHMHAFGIGFESIHEIKAFVSFLRQDVPDVESSVEISKRVDIDVLSVNLGGLCTVGDVQDYLDERDCHGPYGVGFRRPVIRNSFLLSDVTMTILKDVHTKLTTNDGLDYLLWNTNLKEYEAQPVVVSIIGDYDINTYTRNGVDEITYTFSGELENIVEYDTWKTNNP